MKFLVLFLWVLATIQFSNGTVCVTSRHMEIYQTECKAIPNDTDLLSIPRNINYLIINCNFSNNNENLIDFQIFHNLVFISISQCRINQMRPSTFQNLSQLREVYLAELNIFHLPADLFKNSSNIKRLSLIHLSNLIKISPFFLSNCDKIEEITLGGLNISTNIIHLFLLMVHKSLKILTWNNNLQKLVFSSEYFKYFKFDELRLMRNKIDDSDFLLNVESREIYLDFNKIGIFFYMEKYKYLINNTSILSIGHNTINGIFPSIQNQFTTNIEKLFINNNEIKSFHKIFPIIFPKLIYLDASGNKMMKLSDSLRYILQFKQVILSNNPLFCGCELNWLWKYRSKMKLKCSKYTVKNNNSDLSIIKHYQFDLDSKFPCIPPKTFLEIFSATSIIKYSEKTISIDLYQCEYFRLRCLSKADPRPEIELINLNEAAFLKSSMEFEDEITVTTPRQIIRYSQLSENSKYNQLYCIGTNSFGRHTIHLQINRMKGQRNNNNKKKISGIITSLACLRENFQKRNSNKLKVQLLNMFFVFLYTTVVFNN